MTDTTGAAAVVAAVDPPAVDPPALVPPALVPPWNITCSNLGLGDRFAAVRPGSSAKWNAYGSVWMRSTLEETVSHGSGLDRHMSCSKRARHAGSAA